MLTLPRRRGPFGLSLRRGPFGSADRSFQIRDSVCCSHRRSAAAQTHEHTPATSGVPREFPCSARARQWSACASGAWSSPATWSTGRAPAAGDRVPHLGPPRRRV